MRRAWPARLPFPDGSTLAAGAALAVALGVFAVLWGASQALAAAAVGVFVFAVLTLSLNARSLALWGLFLLLFLTVLNYSPIGWLSSGLRVGYARLPLLLLVLAGLVWRLGKRVGPLIGRNADVLLFVAWAVLSGVQGLAPGVSVLYALWLAAALLFLVLALSCFPSIDDAVFHLAVVLVAAYSVPVLLGAAALPTYLSGGSRRLMGALDIDQLHAWGGVTVITGLAVLAMTRRRTRLLSLPVAGVLVVLSLLGVALSGTKIAVAALAVFGVVYLASGGPGARSVAPYALFALVGTWLAQRYLADVTLQRYSLLFVEGMLSSSDQFRLQLWVANVSYGLEHPLFGAGLVNAAQAAVIMDPTLPEGYGAHSTYLQIVSEMGLVGAAIFLLILGRSLLLLARHPVHRGRRAIPLLLMVPPLIVSLTESNLAPGQAMFFPLWIGILLPRWIPFGRAAAADPEPEPDAPARPLPHARTSGPPLGLRGAGG